MKKEVPQKKHVPHDKYFLKSLHQEIDLYDRKLAYLEKYAQFDSAEDREGAEHKLALPNGVPCGRHDNWSPTEWSSIAPISPVIPR